MRDGTHDHSESTYIYEGVLGQVFDVRSEGGSLELFGRQSRQKHSVKAALECGAKPLEIRIAAPHDEAHRLGGNLDSV